MFCSGICKKKKKSKLWCCLSFALISTLLVILILGPILQTQRARARGVRRLDLDSSIPNEQYPAKAHDKS